MKRNLTFISVIAVVVLTFGLVAVAQAQPQTEAPSYSIGSVNNTNQTGSSYSSTVYAVGDNSAPSAQGAPGARGISGPRRSFDHGAETGQSEESPVGEPFVLLLMAALFAAVVAFRTHSHAHGTCARSSARTHTPEV